jgi:acylphosphatase
MVTTLYLHISGRVQGVWYRESLRMEAERLEVTGWVRNRRDGAVEAMVQGEDAALAALIAWAKVGPPAARVDAVVSEPGSGSFTSFERLPSA